MITPRHYEEAVQEIFENVPQAEQENSLKKLMMDVLDSLGYEYGNRLIREERSKDGR